MTTHPPEPAGADWIVITPSGGVRQPLWRRLQAEWPLLRLWTGRELRSRYRQSWLQAGWSVIQPAMILLTYGVVLVGVLQVTGDDIPYLTFAWAGLVPFGFVQQALGQGVGSIQYSASIISKVYFPREVLPLSVVGAGLFDLAVTSVILVGLSWLQVRPPGLASIALVPAYAVLIIWVAGLTVLAATANAFRRDLNLAMPLILRSLFILTPIMYSTSLYSDRLAQLNQLNPFAVVIEVVRDGLVRDRWPNMLPLAVHGLIGIVVLWFSLVVCRRLEHDMSDVA